MRVKYFDYLGCERQGEVVFTIAYREDEEYLGIKDDEEALNDKLENICNKDIKYAEIRKSSECIPLDGEEVV